jgi:FkbM family methyltransferase
MNKLNLIDVGAADNPPSFLKDNDIKYRLLFDAIGGLSYAKKKYKKKNTIIKKCAVFDKECYLPFYVCQKKQVSSLFEPNFVILNPWTLNKKTKIKRNRFNIKKIKKVECCRLDTIISETGVDFDILKIDTQGADFQVIKSLGDYLSTQIIAIFTELFYKECYKNIKLYEKVNNFLKENNFKKVKMFGEKHFMCNDFLYIREDEKKKDKIKLIKKRYEI